MSEYTVWQQLKQEWEDMGPTTTLSRCKQCNDRHFGETTLIIKHINWGEEITICAKCGYRESFVAYEYGQVQSIRFVKSEPPECSAKPKLLTDGGET